ncbi:hypothetical protein [Tengunoibacter tsumagoiensis]|uniref:Histidine kinase N-terminal 7TM region domain-containing protein n=1 Tax=Tengunoibacter tsumagoiensis TaxID=2014871 RepID=A0A402A3W4_9CHLR|nr:hypothetical protein [Tengunoibacter tsumagoiensis]GCE13834.1 hypothetical protein KTT_36930 [Tengunoibacter tsumagoiensis]
MDNVLFLWPAAINVLVTGLFAGVLLRQYLRRQRLSQLYWLLALTMAFVATLAYMGMLEWRPTSAGGIFLFRLYYILGASLMPAWLGLGSLALLTPKRVSLWCGGVLAACSFLAAYLIFYATIDLRRLSQIAGTPGTGILAPGAWLVSTIILNTLGVVLVVAVALYSGWKLWHQQKDLAGLGTSTILWANILILSGALLDASAGSFARLLNLQSDFWLIMAVGWIILFAGVLLAGRRSQRLATASRQEIESWQAVKI